MKIKKKLPFSDMKKFQDKNYRTNQSPEFYSRCVINCIIKCKNRINLIGKDEMNHYKSLHDY